MNKEEKLSAVWYAFWKKAWWTIPRTGIIIGGGVLFLCIVYHRFAWWLCDSPADSVGTFGDQYGALNTLFAGIAFVGLIIAILLQREDLNLQREEMQRAREESEKQTAQYEAQTILMQQQINATCRQFETQQEETRMQNTIQRDYIAQQQLFMKIQRSSMIQEGRNATLQAMAQEKEKVNRPMIQMIKNNAFQNIPLPLGGSCNHFADFDGQYHQFILFIKECMALHRTDSATIRKKLDTQLNPEIVTRFLWNCDRMEDWMLKGKFWLEDMANIDHDTLYYRNYLTRELTHQESQCFEVLYFFHRYQSTWMNVNLKEALGETPCQNISFRFTQTSQLRCALHLYAMKEIFTKSDQQTTHNMIAEYLEDRKNLYDKN